MSLLSQFKDLNKVRKQAKDLQNSLEEKEVIGKAKGITIVANGLPKIKTVEVDEKLLENKEKLQEAIKAASNNLQDNLKKVLMENMKDMPDIGNMLGRG